MQAGVNHSELRHLMKLAQIADTRGLRGIAADLGLTPSTLSRAQNGKLTNGDSLLIILCWLQSTLNLSWHELMHRVTYDTRKALHGE